MRTWRELLKNVIKSPQEKQRIADELNINPITLVRWTNGLSKPHFTHFQRRVTQRMVQSLRNNQPLTRQQAEQEVWHQLEEELLQEVLRLPLETDT